MSTSFTQPILRKGKAVNKSGKRLTKAEEGILQDWYIEYYFTDLSLDIINKRVKLRRDINKSENIRDKESRAQTLLSSITELLQEGYHPFNEEANIKLRNEIISISVPEAVDVYIQHLNDIKLRKKSIQTYYSKLRYFADAYSNLKVNQITDLKITKFLKEQKLSNSWSERTYNAAQQALGAFLKHLVSLKYIETNPIAKVSRLKASTSSDLHKVFTDADLKSIMDYLSANDKFTELFVKSIYYTCIRPKELRQLKVKMIDFDNMIITLPASISKNKQVGTVKITPNYLKELKSNNIDSISSDNYLFSSGSTIGGKLAVGENTPYYRFMSCLKALGLDDKGYTLYSIKHKSNISKYLDGWTVAEIMKAIVMEV
ncbi:site-specific integrase [Pedobacter sp. Leaf194]|uniref:tyrosine-type recombinase/integrase n=1 Tax=Pedobacter sp. Leaf194 TaxID=1736297 RepID=UPI00138EE336|nr:site-specific integrase [Pedobacter sp. Leaf194]